MAEPETSVLETTEQEKPEGMTEAQQLEMKVGEKNPKDQMEESYKKLYEYRDNLIRKRDLTPIEQQEIDAINFLFPDGTEGKAQDFQTFNNIVDHFIEHGDMDIIILYRDHNKMQLSEMGKVVKFAKKYRGIDLFVNELTGEMRLEDMSQMKPKTEDIDTDSKEETTETEENESNTE